MMPMDVMADTQSPPVEWAPVARTMMEQLTEAEQAEVRASVSEATCGFDPSRFKQITPVREGQSPFYVIHATPTLRILLERTGDRLRVLDVVDAEQLAYFRDDAEQRAQ